MDVSRLALLPSSPDLASPEPTDTRLKSKSTRMCKATGPSERPRLAFRQKCINRTQKGCVYRVLNELEPLLWAPKTSDRRGPNFGTALSAHADGTGKCSSEC